jgi:hypothetical protein
MITAKKLLNGLKELGTLTCFSIKRIPHKPNELPAYTEVTGRGAFVTVSEETYGRITQIYFYCNTDSIYEEIQNQIISLGGKIDSKYRNDGTNRGGRVTVNVSPIKGWHHWE